MLENSVTCWLCTTNKNTKYIYTNCFTSKTAPIVSSLLLPIFTLFTTMEATTTNQRPQLMCQQIKLWSMSSILNILIWYNQAIIPCKQYGNYWKEEEKKWNPCNLIRTPLQWNWISWKADHQFWQQKERSNSWRNCFFSILTQDLR